MAKNSFPADFISLADLYLAYKKAKVDAYYDSSHPSALAFTEFEQNLQENLKSLYGVITKNETEWWYSSEFIGGFLYVPKSIDNSAWADNTQVHYRSVDPNQDWEQQFEDSGKNRLDASYRLIITPTVNFQILSALWILKVGHKFEEKLDKRLSYGNRLRRKRHAFEDFGPYNGPLNNDSLGLFAPYFSAYRTWRQRGLDSMRELVEKQRNATAITMDLAGFYHNVSPSFLLRPSFLKKINVELETSEKKFTRLFLMSIYHWYKQTPDYEDRPEGALPVGLSASKLISNVLLFELDNQVHEAVAPAYYGRYVDDIFLVVETPEGVTSGDGVVEYLAQKIDCLKINRKKGEQPELRLRLGYADDCELRFTAKKQKIFSLSSEYGLDLVNQISSQIKAQSSEYRMLPELPRTSVEMAEQALLASSDASLTADALRKADSVSIKRLGFSLLVRDIESYSMDLSVSEWTDLRGQFYGLIHRYLITPKGVFDFFSYYPRIFRLMVANQDFTEAVSLVVNLKQCFDLIERTTTSYRKGQKIRIRKCKEYFQKSLLQAALQASTAKNFSQWPHFRRLVQQIVAFSEAFPVDIRKKALSDLSKQLLLADLGVRSYKDYWYYEQTGDISIVAPPKGVGVRKVLKLASIREFRKLANLKLPHWPALVFSTRPLSVQEIVLIAPDVLENPRHFERCVLGLRGARVNDRVQCFMGRLDDYGSYVSVPKPEIEKVYIALTNFETTDAQYCNALQGKPDRTLLRYERINTLINGILRAKNRSDYIVFPECSIPRRWAISIAGKLARQGISLIAGTEYYTHKKGTKTVRNDCLVSLATRWPGYPSNLVFMQPKLQPSHGEKMHLSGAGRHLYSPHGKQDPLPIYQHGSFHFGVIICSDLTTPHNRVRFQGKVDSLFVLEWNPDVKTFSYLVEGASHDIHTFVIQVNNRSYGDSRVRAPYRVDHKRDLVRLKGGIEDYFVIAEIDYQSLRKFHKMNRMNDENSEFKPVPIGFLMSEHRKD